MHQLGDPSSQHFPALGAPFAPPGPRWAQGNEEQGSANPGSTVAGLRSMLLRALALLSHSWFPTWKLIPVLKCLLMHCVQAERGKKNKKHKFSWLHQAISCMGRQDEGPGWSLCIFSDGGGSTATERPRGPLLFAAPLSCSHQKVSGSGPSLPIIEHKHRVL